MKFRDELEKICQELQKIANYARENDLMLTEAAAVVYLGNFAKDTAGVGDSETNLRRLYDKYSHILNNLRTR